MFRSFCSLRKPSTDEHVLLIVNGQYSHTKNLDVLYRAWKHSAAIFTLPPHSKHIMQPLDVGTISGVPKGVWGVQHPPPSPKFRSFDKAEPNPQSCGKYVCNNLTRIRLSLIFRVVSWKALPASYDPHSGIFFLSKAWCDVSIKYQKLRKFYHMKWNFLYQITAASRTPD
jgi:hypothetical protein